MERWEEELVQHLRQAQQSPSGPTGGTAPTRRADPLADAFGELVQRVTRSAAHVAEALGQTVDVTEERDAGRYQWSFAGRRLRVRIDRDAKKFFLSVESDAGLEMSELWVEDGQLMTDGEGTVRSAEPARLVQRAVTLLFRGR